MNFLFSFVAIAILFNLALSLRQVGPVVKIDGDPVEDEELEPGPVIDVNGEDTIDIDGVGPVEDIDGIPLEDQY